MKSLVAWIVASAAVIGLPLAGVPTQVAVLVASPFAVIAGWTLIEPPRHRCGWCGRRFGGRYEWVCPDCEGEAVSW